MIDVIHGTTDKPVTSKQLQEAVQKIKELVGEENYLNGRFEEAISIFDELVLSHKFTEFLTLEAYKYID